MTDYVVDTPTGWQIISLRGPYVFKVSELVAQQTKDLVKLNRDVYKLANLELSQPSITPDLANQITDIKQQASN